jgi:CBS domain containing-hemolysin-like protein
MGVISASMAATVAKTLHVRQSVMTIVFGFLVGTAVLIFGEIVPKVWARHYTIQWALFVTPIMNAWTRLIDPFSKAAARFTNYLLIGYRKKPNTPYLQENELKIILENAALPSHSKKILDNLLDFSSTKARDIMVPRQDMLAIANDLPLEKIIRSVLVSGFSRIPVYNGTLNRPIGILYAKDLLVAWRSGTLLVLDDLLRPLHFVEPDMPLSELFRVFKTGRHHMALVRRGETGPIEGLVTLQDALETISGDIHEEI